MPAEHTEDFLREIVEKAVAPLRRKIEELEWQVRDSIQNLDKRLDSADSTVSSVRTLAETANSHAEEALRGVQEAKDDAADAMRQADRAEIRAEDAKREADAAWHHANRG